MSEEERRKFARDWGVYISAVNPGPGRQRVPPDEACPLSLTPEEQKNDFSFLTSIVSRVQRHVCSPAYCSSIESAYNPIRLSDKCPQKSARRCILAVCSVRAVQASDRAVS